MELGVNVMIDERPLAIDGWMSPTELAWLYETASRLPTNALVVEVGCWLGRSTSAVWLGSGGNIRLICIDTWKGQPKQHAPTERKFLAETDIKQGFLDNMRGVGATPTPYDGNPKMPGLYYLVGDSRDTIPLLDDRSVDWGSNDGDHFKLGRDLDLMCPKMKKNSLLSGHDYFCYFDYIQPDIHDRFYINEIHGSIWVKHWPAYAPRWYSEEFSESVPGAGG